VVLAVLLGLGVEVVWLVPSGIGVGTRQVLWQFAACALQAIMQVVTVEDCANRIFRSADAPLAAAAVIAATARTIANFRISPPPARILIKAS
jgi:hypothetical protein